VIAGRLPDEGPVRLGPVTLPAGRLIEGYPELDHVAWVTEDPVPDAGRVWAALAGLHPRTGLVPIQVDGHPGRVRDPLNLSQTENPRGADGLDVGALIEEMWQDGRPDEPDLGWIETRSPFIGDFPGLAPPEHAPLTPAERERALDLVTQEARIGLVAAERPADVLPVIGWGGLENRGESLLPLTAILRSWEDRFGARLIAVGDVDLGLFVERPPRTLRAAQRIAAEQVVLADECIAGSRGIPGVAELLVNSPVWSLWWD
jgi:Domain of unknown function (DUF4253)